MGRFRLSVAGLMALVVMTAVGLVLIRFASEAWASMVLLLTLGALASAIIATLYRREARRAFWLGFALFGWGYMLLSWEVWWKQGKPELIGSLLFEELVQTLEPGVSPRLPSPDLIRVLGGSRQRDHLILSKLDRPIPVNFPKATPLEDVLKSIKAATTGPNDNGIPIFVDPVGLQQTQRTLQSPVTLKLDGIPLRTSLRLMLKQLDLTYIVRGGVLEITTYSQAVDHGDPYHRIGHCYLALLTACLGGLVGRFLYMTRDHLVE